MWTSRSLPFVFVLIACGEAEPPAAIVPPAPAVENPAVEPPVIEAPVIEAPEPSIDLLHASDVALAVSSAYRDRASEIPKLFDGDLETAWNSRTGDLVGAWIEVRLTTATLTAIELTVGYTRMQDDVDLFTGNHRIAHVRVLRDGVEVATQALDVSSRALQSIPIAGASPGGTYRIEITEVTPGTRTDWQEACVSELRLLGRDPEAHVGERLPRYAILTLPEARPSASTVDREAFARALEHRTFDLRTRWVAYERDVLRDQHESGDPGIDSETTAEDERLRRQMLEGVITLIEPVDALAADRLRVASVARVTGAGNTAYWEAHSADLDTLARGLMAGAEWLDDDAARCRVLHFHGGALLARVDVLVATDREWSEMDEAMGDGATGPDLTRVSDTLSGLALDWSSDRVTVTRRLLRMEAPASPLAANDWTALVAVLTRSEAECPTP